eukprot:5888018-Pyramimonas_sp.AAC.1
MSMEPRAKLRAGAKLRLALALVLAVILINTFFLYWAANHSSEPGASEGMLARILGGDDAQDPSQMVHTPVGKELSNPRSGSRHSSPVLLSDMPCPVPIHANETALAMNALIVVDYSLGGPAFPEHDQIWMGE